MVTAIVLTAIAALAMFATRHLHNCDAHMSEMIEQKSRLDDLTDEAMRRYPQSTMLQAMQRYTWDLDERIETLRKNAEGTDVVYAIQSDMKDCIILQVEIARLINQEVEFNSHFNVLTSAQV